MPPRHAIVIVVDGLRASALGAYGNTWHATPAVDALASRGVVVDWMWCESLDLGDYCHGAWSSGPLPQAMREGGIAFTLVTDDEEVAQRAASAALGAVVCVAEEPPAAAAGEVSETALGRLIAVAIERLAQWADDESPHSRIFWLHARGFRGPWDAPFSLRADLTDADDPAPPTYTTPPECVAVADHDAIFGYRTAYAAQTIVLDECLGALLDEIAERRLDQNTLIALVGCRGFALGEHGVAGADAGILFSETLHVPCVVSAPTLAPAPPRWSGLAVPSDLWGTIASWLEVPMGKHGASSVDLLSPVAPSAPSRSYVVARDADGQCALRTAGWMVRRDAAGADAAADTVELYAKPDDRWEANEIADRCSDVAQRLLAVADRVPTDSGANGGELLDADLISPLR